MIYTNSVLSVDDAEKTSLKENTITFMKCWNLIKIFDSMQMLQVVLKQWWKLVLFHNMRIYIANWQSILLVSMISWDG